MIRTITEAEALTLAVRGDVPGVLDGAEALVIQTCLDCEAGAVEVGHCAACGEPKVRSCPSCSGTGGDRALPLANQLVQAHLVGWLGQGERCLTPDHLTRAARGSDCPGCDGSGWIRRPANRYLWLTPEAHDGLPDWIRLALIWGSVVRVAAGMGPIHLSPYYPRNDLGRRVGYFGEVLADSRVVLPVGVDRTPANCDAEWLSENFALIDNAPAGRAIRFEVPE